MELKKQKNEFEYKDFLEKLSNIYLGNRDYYSNSNANIHYTISHSNFIWKKSLFLYISEIEVSHKIHPLIELFDTNNQKKVKSIVVNETEILKRLTISLFCYTIENKSYFLILNKFFDSMDILIFEIEEDFDIKEIYSLKNYQHQHNRWTEVQFISEFDSLVFIEFDFFEIFNIKTTESRKSYFFDIDNVFYDEILKTLMLTNQENFFFYNFKNKTLEKFKKENYISKVLLYDSQKKTLITIDQTGAFRIYSIKLMKRLKIKLKKIIYSHQPIFKPTTVTKLKPNHIVFPYRGNEILIFDYFFGKIEKISIPQTRNKIKNILLNNEKEAITVVDITKKRLLHIYEYK